MKLRNIIILSIAIILSGCFIFKKTNKDDVAHSDKQFKRYMDSLMAADSVKAAMNAAKEASTQKEAKIYRGSRTKIVHIIDTKLDLKPDWTKEQLYGKATITFKPYFYNTDSLVLDAKYFEINQVTMLVGKALLPLKYTYDSTQIHINLGKEYTKNDTIKIFISYTARPNEVKGQVASQAITDAKGLYFINADGKDPDKPKQIWTQGETESNSCWFPTYDSPNDRMTQEITITVDTQYVTLSNGLMVSSKKNNDGTRTDVWKQSLPAAPYLTMFAVGNFSIVKDKWRNIDVNYYVEPSYKNYAKAIFGHTPEMIEFFSTRFGFDYPWEKFSQIVCRDYVSGAMENTTAVLHGEYLQRNDRELLDETNEDVISHELSHHWFGDLVTCESWSNIPLNESFATYCEYLWNEHEYGRDYADQKFQHELTAYLASSRSNDPDVIRFYYEDKENMFDGISYAKGGRILHMLRKAVGDDAFFASLKLYLNTNKFSSVEIHNLRLAFEQVTGTDMNWFFNEWWLNHGHPDFDIDYAYDGSNHKEIVKVKQTQDTSENPLYTMPVMVDIYVNGKVEHHKINVTKLHEDFELDVASQPDLVNFDAEKMLLCTKTDNHSTKEWVFMYNNAPLYMDRYEALNHIVKNWDGDSDPSSVKVLEAALKDKNANLRSMALKNVSKLIDNISDVSRKDAMKGFIKNMAITDPKSLVRVQALIALNRNFDDTTLYPFYKNIAVTDLSYDVDVEALNLLSDKDQKQAFELAKILQKDSSGALITGIASIYAEHGTEEQNPFFLKMYSKVTGFERYTFIASYGKFLLRCDDATIDAGMKLLEDVARHGSPWWIKLSAIQALSNISDKYQERETSEKDKLSELTKSSASKMDTDKQQAKVDAADAKKKKIEDMITQIKKEETDKNLIPIYNLGGSK
jgi:aminopeptidase N